MRGCLAVIGLITLAGCGGEESSGGGSGGAGAAASGGSGAIAGASTGGASSGGAAGTGGSGNLAGQGAADSGADAAIDTGTTANCSLLLEMMGLAHVSTAAELKKVIAIPQPGPSSWQSLRVELDVHHAGWSEKQGQYEVFTLLRGNKWVGNAVGYIAFVGPTNRKTVMVANLNLPFAAAPDGRRISKNYPYLENVDYHLDYIYDVKADLRELVVSVGGVEVTRVTGQVSVPVASPPLTSIEVPAIGFTFLMGGELTDGPDAPTLDWQFSNVRITGCH